MRLILKCLLVAASLLSLNVLSYEPQLTVEQCARFNQEAANIQLLIKTASGVQHRQLSNRAGRLKERIEVFCQNPTELESQIVVALKVPVELAISGQAQTENNAHSQLSSYRDQRKQQAWQRFYQRPPHCDSYKNNMAELVRCSDEQAAQKLLFERQWAIRHPVKTAFTTEPKHAEQEQKINDVINTHTKVVKASKPKVDLRDPSLYVSSVSKVEDISSGFIPLWQYIGEYVIAVILLLVFLFVIKSTSPYITRMAKRHFSNHYLKSTLRKGLLKTHYSLHHNLMLPTSSGNIKLDQVITSKHGVFLIVSQSQLGDVYADRHSETWIERNKKHEAHFTNPLRCLDQRLSLLRELIGLDDEVIGLIVFNQEVTFKTPTPAEVCLLAQLINRIDCYQSNVLDVAKVEKINRLLIAYSASNTGTVAKKPDDESKPLTNEPLSNSAE
ncbi:NERD domain-containing protein [Pseudoalteromonas sp. MMG005]|uniref:NERD domain-containing protein n=1 Tax=Pseudoalteromonas sp. MMG005 TaxID=2822682 RepID=UPI001B3A20F1|nr:NERD domain-containing protein [Pseudoalteromonas sp. MMG005]MBQ4848311.1 NERD domain-containing protein [Pseudoalteromonas sp. MMG005]